MLTTFMRTNPYSRNSVFSPKFQQANRKSNLCCGVHLQPHNIVLKMIKKNYLQKHEYLRIWGASYHDHRYKCWWAKKNPFYLVNVADLKITLCELKRDIMEWKKGKRREGMGNYFHIAYHVLLPYRSFKIGISFESKG